MEKLRYSVPVALLLIFGFISLTGCSTGSGISKEEREFDLEKSASRNNSEQLVSTTEALKEKSSIDKENLESLSSSLERFIIESDLLSTADKDELMYKVIEYLNTPYLWGGTSKRGIDCSAFVQTVMYQSLGVLLPRTSLEQSSVGETVDRADLKFGDLLFFDTMRKGRTSHVGIYLEDGYFVHSGSKTGVIVASLDSDFYSRTFLHAKRVVTPEELETLLSED